ncbi:MAG: OsmC family protein [Coprothermobacterota bacterium]|nr:OsmC family protein [Coprothermobacterota bacterium]
MRFATVTVEKGESIMAHCSVKWVQGMQFVASDDLGHAMVLDTSAEVGGLGQGFRPGQLLLVALGGCTGMDVISILEKKKQKITSLEVHVKGENATEFPKRYTKMTVEYRLRGIGISEEAVQHAIQLSEDKYCLVRATLLPGVQIESSYTIEHE